MKTINDVWLAIEQGKTVNWGNDSYIVVVEAQIPGNEYQKNHFTNRDGKLLAVRCKSNWFGSLLDVSELGSLYISNAEEVQS